MTSMNVLTLAEKLKKLYRIKDTTYANWLKAVGPISDLSIDQITNEIVLDQRIYWLERAEESTTKLRISSLKAMRPNLPQAKNPLRTPSPGRRPPSPEIS